MFQDKIGVFSRMKKSPYRDTFPKTATKPFFLSTREIEVLVTVAAILGDSFVTGNGSFLPDAQLSSQNDGRYYRWKVLF